MTNHHSPSPWSYEYSPYTLQKGSLLGTDKIVR
jgi:hypothetical protein